ncbi:cytochrome bd oxidase small subunit CydS [Paenibacillus sp. S-38]
MDEFLIFYLPPLIVAVSLVFLFLWNGRTQDGDADGHPQS